MRKIGMAVVGLAFALGAGCQGGREHEVSSLSGVGGLSGVAAPGEGGAGGGGGDQGGGGGGAGAGDGTGVSGGAGGATGTGGTMASARGCSDLFDPAHLVDYGFDITPDELAKIEYEFRNRAALEAAGVDYKTYHPIVFHYGSETVTDAMVRLKGQSSWRQTVRDDGDKAKMQFVVSFEEVNSAGKFHGVSKIVLDMPQNDETFLQERLGFTAMAELFGMPAPCANSARVTINGQYYGLYAAEENVGGGFIKRVFPDAPHGDLFGGGRTPQTNELMPDKERLKTFWAARNATEMAAVVDLEWSVTEWAAEALLNNADGYYGGSHNYYLYDYAGKGYRWLIDDADATFAWQPRSDLSPIYWWVGRSPGQSVGYHYLLVMADATWRARYIDALRQLLARWDVAKLQRWIDDWSAQIADAVLHDPHRLRDVDKHVRSIAAMRKMVVDRSDYIARFLACQDRSGDASDGDGDGFTWCNDCDDRSAGVNPGAAEICGNGVDDNCNRWIDVEDGCPAAPPPPM